MAKQSTDVCLVGATLRDHFGPIVAKVGQLLTELGPMPLQLIHQRVGDKMPMVRHSLMTLIQHNLVAVEIGHRNVSMYSIVLEQVICLIRMPRYVHAASILYGDLGAAIIEKMFKLGLCRLSELLSAVTSELSTQPEYADKTDELPKKLYNLFKQIVDDRFIICHVDVLKINWFENRLRRDDGHDDERPVDAVPFIDLTTISSSIATHVLAGIKVEPGESAEPVAKKRRLEESTSTNEEGQYWRVNVIRFNVHLRDELIVEAIERHYNDKKLSDIMRVILLLAERRTHHLAGTSTNLSKHDITNEVLKHHICKDIKQVTQYLTIFDADMEGSFVSLVERNAGGATYCVNILKTLTEIVQDTIASIVEHNFGEKCARVFRVLLIHKALQQKQIEEVAMLPPKECREFLFILITNAYVQQLALPKWHNDYIPSRTLYEFGVDLELVAQRCARECRKAISNVLKRREHEFITHKLLFERKQAIDDTIAAMHLDPTDEEQKAQIDDLYSSLSKFELDTVSNVKSACDKLDIAQIQLDETLFLFNTWLKLRIANTV